MAKTYRIAGLGGTFDHFHIGHRHFLAFAAEQAEQLWVGLTTEQLHHTKQWPASIQTYQQRYDALASALQKIGQPFRIFPLNDAFGPTLENSTVECVVVTEHSVAGGQSINRKRLELGLAELPIRICSLLRDSQNQILSSTRIRSGELQRNGQTWLTDIQFGNISATARQLLAQPLGPVVTAPTASDTLQIVVGDICLQNFQTHRWPFWLAVIDQRSGRAPIATDIPAGTPTLLHPPGQIQAEVCNWLRQFFDQQPAYTRHQLLNITGEEDLVAAEAILTAPLESRMYYGQPNQGMVEVIVTEEMKQRLKAVLTA